MKSFFCPLLFCLCLPVFAADKPSPISVEQLVKTTLAANPEVQFYEAEIAAAKAGRSGAGKLSNPELSLEVGRMHVGAEVPILTGWPMRQRWHSPSNGRAGWD